MTIDSTISTAPITASVNAAGTVQASVSSSSAAVSGVSGGAGPAGATGPQGPAGSGGSGATYSLPVATSSVLGGVKQGGNVTIGADGTISVSAPVASLPYSSITGTPSLATVATSGSYADLANKPSIPSAYTLPTATESVLGGVKVGGGVSISDGVISVSTSYAAVSHTHTASAITDFSSAALAAVTWTTITGKPSFFSGAYADLTGKPTLGTLAAQSGTFSGTSSGTNTGDQTITLTGDVTGSGTGSFAATLSSTGVSAGTYTSVTVDAKGRVTAGSSPTIAYSSLTGTPTIYTLSKTLERFTARDNQPPATNYATLDSRNSILVLEYDASTEESAYFVGVIDESMTLASGLTVRIWWMADTATSGNVRWGVQLERTGTDNDADSFDTNAQATSAANGTSGVESVASITITTIDSLTAGDRYRLRVYRVAADATNDTMTGDAQLIAVEVRAA